jgi:putative aldouronate transport system substrate-binding protein
MRVDWVVKLWTAKVNSLPMPQQYRRPVYTPYMPLTGKIEIETPNLEGTATEIVTKDYDAAGNIVALMNEKGSISGVEAVNMLREYIDKAYNGYYGTARSNLFIGQNAAWDVDELVALLRCVVANPQTLNGTDNVQGIFSREDANNQRRVDMMRLAGHLFGVRGLESRQDYLYVSEDANCMTPVRKWRPMKPWPRCIPWPKKG